MNKKTANKLNLKKYKLFGKYSILQFMFAIGLAAFIVSVILELF